MDLPHLICCTSLPCLVGIKVMFDLSEVATHLHKRAVVVNYEPRINSINKVNVFV